MNKLLLVSAVFTLFAALDGKTVTIDIGNSPRLQRIYERITQHYADAHREYTPIMLPIDENIRNENFYDSEDYKVPCADDVLGSSPPPERSVDYGPPYPIFLRYLRDLLQRIHARQPPNMPCFVEKALDSKSHPCRRQNGSYFILSLPGNHLIVACADRKTNKLTAPKFDLPVGWNSSFVYDFRTPPLLEINRTCQIDDSGLPVCQRLNIFYHKNLIVEDVSCCCEGPLCGTVIFEQPGDNSLPYIVVQFDATRYLAGEQGEHGNSSVYDDFGAGIDPIGGILPLVQDDEDKASKIKRFYFVVILPVTVILFFLVFFAGIFLIRWLLSPSSPRQNSDNTNPTDSARNEGAISPSSEQVFSVYGHRSIF